MSPVLRALAAEGKWPLTWDEPVYPTSSSAVLAYIEVCASRDRLMRDALAAVSEQGKVGRVRSVVRRYLASATARMHALAAAIKKKHGPLAKVPEDDLLAIPMAAHAQSAWKATFGRPIARAMLKRNGVDYRWIVSANVFQYAQERLAKAVVDAVTLPFPTQFMSNDRGGVDGLEQWMRETMPLVKRVITFDIPRCFALMKHSSVADALPISRKVIDQVLFVPRARIKHIWLGPKGSMPKDLASNVQASSPDRGLAEGSALSAAASELVISMVLRDVACISDAVHVASHGDNLVVLLGDASFEEHVIDILIASVCKHFDAIPGELAGRVTVSSVYRPFDFCGRHYRWSAKKLHVSVKEDRRDWFLCRTLVNIEDVIACKSPQERNKGILRLRRSILGWLNQHKGDAELMAEVLDTWSLIPKKLPT